MKQLNLFTNDIDLEDRHPTKLGICFYCTGFKDLLLDTCSDGNMLCSECDFKLNNSDSCRSSYAYDEDEDDFDDDDDLLDLED